MWDSPKGTPLGYDLLDSCTGPLETYFSVGLHNGNVGFATVQPLRCQEG